MMHTFVYAMIALGFTSAGFIVASLFAAGAYERGRHAGFTDGRERGKWDAMADRDRERHARVMGAIHHPLGSPVRYATLDSLMPRTTESE